jgi:hypothetical protein
VGRSGRNVIELLAILNCKSNPEPFDTACLNALKVLKESNLFLKKDIQNCNLVATSCHIECHLRFDYLAGIYPAGLQKHRHWQETRTPPILMLINSRDSSTAEQFQLFLTTALKHHPEDIGLLFQKDDKGKTAFEGALNKYGHEATFGSIEQFIPLDGAELLPLLHRVVENAPQYSSSQSFLHSMSYLLR